MTLICARLKEVMGMKKAFIKKFGEQQLIDDFNTAEAMRNLHAKQVREYRDRRDSVKT